MVTMMNSDVAEKVNGKVGGKPVYVNQLNKHAFPFFVFSSEPLYVWCDLA